MKVHDMKKRNSCRTSYDNKNKFTRQWMFVLYSNVLSQQNEAHFNMLRS